MNKHSAQRKAIGLLDFVARIANSWLDENQKHSLVNYLKDAASPSKIQIFH